MKKEFKIRDLERQGLRRRKSIKVWESSVPTLGDVNLFFYHKKKIRRKKTNVQHQRFNIDVRNDFPISDNWETEAWVASKKDGSTMFCGGLPKYFVKKSGRHVSGVVLPESGNREVNSLDPYLNQIQFYLKSWPCWLKTIFWDRSLSFKSISAKTTRKITDRWRHLHRF